jgi:hypothetical protein
MMPNAADSGITITQAETCKGNYTRRMQVTMSKEEKVGNSGR